MRHVAQSQCAKVGRGHGLVVVALTLSQAQALALTLPVLSGGSKYIYIHI